MCYADNEYSQSEIRGQYFELLKKQYRDGGIVVPLYVLLLTSGADTTEAASSIRS